jgi:hypothetical protein
MPAAAHTCTPQGAETEPPLRAEPLNRNVARSQEAFELVGLLPGVERKSVKDVVARLSAQQLKKTGQVSRGDRLEPLVLAIVTYHRCRRTKVLPIDVKRAVSIQVCPQVAGVVAGPLFPEHQPPWMRHLNAMCIALG